MVKRLTMRQERENMLRLNKRWLKVASPHERPHYEATIRRLEVLIARNKARQEDRE